MIVPRNQTCLLTSLLLALAIGPAGCAGGDGATGIGQVRAPLSEVENFNVMSHADIHLVAKAAAANIDGPISTYTKDGTRYWVMPNVEWSGNDYVVYHTTTTHTLAAGLSTPEGTSRTKLPQWNFFSNMGSGRMWLMSTYKIGEGEALGFVHVEHADNTYPSSGYFGRGRIGVAYFKKGTNGDKWRYMGHKIAPYGDPPNANIEGAPYLVKDGYVHVYYLDSGGHAVAKTNLGDLIHSARMGWDSPAWYKYSNGGWNSAGLGGDFSPLNFEAGTIMHAGAAYSTYAKKYYILATRQKTPSTSTALLLYESCDAVNWALRTPLEENNTATLKVGWQYTTLVNTDYTQWPVGSVGASFYIYAGWEYDQHKPGNPHDALWKRLRINLDASDCTCGGGCG